MWWPSNGFLPVCWPPAPGVRNSLVQVGPTAQLGRAQAAESRERGSLRHGGPSRPRLRSQLSAFCARGRALFTALGLIGLNYCYGFASLEASRLRLHDRHANQSIHQSRLIPQNSTSRTSIVGFCTFKN
ncbi:hypothetical protein SKAU_G00084460 [Synaphobranchus kaupii]|uniref:Uncharacterized protein n=1 Tax=Synaphobranchus kaupii TaxID=118154 RepID=A0A9Q1J5W4_SYNKA|nr:hypothetical protein SKAU_G00084460 [Synaphobranchus kaupii]